MKFYKRIIEKLYYKCFPGRDFIPPDPLQQIPVTITHVQPTTLHYEIDIPTHIIKQDPDFVFRMMLDGMRAQLKPFINTRIYNDQIINNTRVRGELKVLPLDKTYENPLFNPRDPDGIY